MTAWAPRVQAQPTSQKPSNVTVALLNGQKQTGVLLQADNSKVVLQGASGSTELQAGDVDQIQFSNAVDRVVAPVELLLRDGSKISAQQVQGKETAWTTVDMAGKEIALPSKSIKAIRLKPVTGELQNAWQTALQGSIESDALIVSRPGNTIDRINGVVLQISDAKVSFDLDGQQIEVPFEKLLGVLFFQRVAERIQPSVEVITKSQDTWMAESLEWKEPTLQIKTPLGVQLALRPDQLLSVNYGSANIRWISELEPIEAVADATIEFKSPVRGLDKALSPRFISSNGSLLGAVGAGDKDLLFAGPGRYVFRAPEGFSHMLTRIERTDTGTHRSEISIQVWQDDQKLFDERMAIDQESIDVQVPLAANKKTKLAVGCDAKLMVGTEVTWKQPRLKR